MPADRLKRILAHPLAWALPLQAFLLFWNLNLLDPWGDERHTQLTVSESFPEILSSVSRNIHPPLYFVLGHFWSHFFTGASVLIKMRSLSAVWGILATIAFYCFWLRRSPVRFQRLVLTLWTLSPCLLLYARMARSYSMQLTLAIIAIFAALRWIERPAGWRELSFFVISSVVLVYTHYLPGYAIIATTCLILLYRKEFQKVIVSVFLIAVCLAPWLTVMRSTINGWLSMHPYQVGSFAADHAVRLAYWFISFSFGEMLSTPATLLAIFFTPPILYLFYRGVQKRPVWLDFILIASGIGYVAVSRWEGYPFTASHVLFALPFFFMLLVTGYEALGRRRSFIFTSVIVLYLLGDYNYFGQTGFLNKGYAMPNEAMARTIRDRSRGAPSLLVLDSPFPDPLIERLGPQTPVTMVYDEQTATIARHQIENVTNPVWFCRRAHDVSSGGVISKFERDILHSHETIIYEFLPYNLIESWALRWLRGPGQSEFAYRCLEIK